MWLRVREAGALKTLIADGGTIDLPMVRGEAKGDGEKSQDAAGDMGGVAWEV